jgi:hypothetical protein
MAEHNRGAARHIDIKRQNTCSEFIGHAPALPSFLAGSDEVPSDFRTLCQGMELPERLIAAGGKPNPSDGLAKGKLGVLEPMPQSHR